MTDERLAAVRKVREEADNLRLACIGASISSSLLHIAYSQDMEMNIPLAEAVLLGRLGAVSL